MKAGEILLLPKHGNIAFEYVPDRLGIAAQIMAGLLAHSGDERIDHILHADDLVHNAVELTDKLIARIKETQK